MNQKPKILVVEDEAIVARDILALLAAMDYEPLTHVSSAERAIELSGELRPDLVLMDIRLAGAMDGITAAQAIRSRFGLPVVFLTAFAGGETITRAKLAEPFGYITKPFNERELHTTIEIALYKHQIEVELRRSEAKFRTLFDSTADAVLLFHRDRILDCNRATLEIFGCASRDEFCRRHVSELSPPQQPSGVNSLTLTHQHIAQTRAEGSLRFDWVHRRLDSGADFDAEVLLNEIDLDGGPVMQAVVRDISVRKHAEEEVRRAKQLLDSVVENIPAVIFLKRANDLRHELVNRACEDLLGMSRNDMLGKTVYDLFPKDQADAFTAEDRRAILSGRITEISSEPTRTANGSTRYLDTRKVVLKDATGRPTHLLGISLDITEQRIAAEALRAAKAEAERANKAKSQFLSNMSHELRTPLNAVLGFAQLLELDRAAPLKPHQVEYVRQILRGGHHLLSLVNELLDLTSIDGGRMSMNLEPVSVRALLTECQSLVLASAQECQVSVTLDPASQGDCWVVADRLRLKQVALNLLSNAIKYNKRNGSVELGWGDDANYVRISVTDTGPGLSPEQLGRLFQPFERLGAGNSAILGFGIGLTLSRHLISAMHGEVGVDSAVGRGSTFWLRLPRVQGRRDSSVSTDAAHESVAPIGDGPPGRRAIMDRRTVLCIDDNSANLTLIQSFLAVRSDLHVIGVMRPEEGVDMAVAERPCVILLDIKLPGIDGFEVLRLLRANDATRDTPVIAVSASAMPADVERGLAAGFDDYITKPIDCALLVSAIDRTLGKC